MSLGPFLFNESIFAVFKEFQDFPVVKHSLTSTELIFNSASVFIYYSLQFVCLLQTRPGAYIMCKASMMYHYFSPY